MTRAERIEALRERGVGIYHKTAWRGTPGVDREQYELPDKVSQVNFGFSAEDWVSIAMREGENYVGGCCGNMSMLQDYTNAVFRDGGGVDDSRFLLMGQVARGHEGFDEFEADIDDEAFETHLSHWDALDPWARMGVIFSTVEPMLTPMSTEVPRKQYAHEDDDKFLWSTLNDTISRLDWNALFSDDQDLDVDDEHTLSRHVRAHTREANRLVDLARLVDPAKRLMERLESDAETFEGWALVAAGTEEPMVNHMGQCIYATREEAEYIIELWDRQAKQEAEYAKDQKREPRERADHELVQCAVTVAEGFQVIRPAVG